MTLFLPSLRTILLGTVLLVLAGCGSSSSSPSSTPGVAPTTSATSPGLTPVPPTAQATAVVTGGSVAAVVNGQRVPISLFRLLVSLDQHRAAGQAVTAQQLTDAAMNQVIVLSVVGQYAAKHHITVSDSQVQAEISKDEKSAGSARAFEARLAQIGLNRATFKQLIAPTLLQQKVSTVVAPLDATPHPIAHIRHILIGVPPVKQRTDAAARALAQKLFTQVTHGGDFAALAKHYSDDTQSGAAGGYLSGCCRPGQTVAPFNYAAFHAKLRTIILVHSRFGYHIMEVLSRGSQAPTLKEQQTAQQTQFSAWIQKQVATAKVQRLARVSRV